MIQGKRGLQRYSKMNEVGESQWTIPDHSYLRVQGWLRYRNFCSNVWSNEKFANLFSKKFLRQSLREKKAYKAWVHHAPCEGREGTPRNFQGENICKIILYPRECALSHLVVFYHMLFSRFLCYFLFLYSRTAFVQNSSVLLERKNSRKMFSRHAEWRRRAVLRVKAPRPYCA